MYARRTVLHSSGPLAPTVAASCAIPLFFQPVRLGGRPHVDGGVGDLLALASCGPTETVLSVDLHTQGLSTTRRLHARSVGVLPTGSPTLEGTTRLQLRGLPYVGPGSMGRGGRVAMAAGHAAMAAALRSRGHWGGDRVVGVDVPAAVREAQAAAAAAARGAAGAAAPAAA